MDFSEIGAFKGSWMQYTLITDAEYRGYIGGARILPDGRIHFEFSVHVRRSFGSAWKNVDADALRHGYASGMKCLIFGPVFRHFLRGTELWIGFGSHSGIIYKKGVTPQT